MSFLGTQMSDTSTIWRDFTRGDWVMNGAQLQSGGDLTTAVLISLFTDRQARSDDVIPDGTTDQRGWWADSDVLIGSRLWLLNRAKQTTETLNRAVDYISEALQWLIDDGAVQRFNISVQWMAPGQLGARLIAHRSDGTSVAMNYGWAWST